MVEAYKIDYIQEGKKKNIDGLHKSELGWFIYCNSIKILKIIKYEDDRIIFL